MDDTIPLLPIMLPSVPLDAKEGLAKIVLPEITPTRQLQNSIANLDYGFRLLDELPAEAAERLHPWLLESLGQLEVQIRQYRDACDTWGCP